MIAHKSTTQEIISLRKVFDLIDKGRNGTVDLKEFKRGLAQSRFSEQEIEQIFDSIVSTLYYFVVLLLLPRADNQACEGRGWKWVYPIQ